MLRSARIDACPFHLRLRNDRFIFQEQTFPLHLSVAVAEFIHIRRVSFRNRFSFPVQLQAVRMHHPDGNGGNGRRSRLRTGGKREPEGGNEQQAEDLIRYIRENAGKGEEGIWETNIFGKSIAQIVDDGIQAKISQLTEDCQVKLQDTLQKIINDSNGGMICIII